ncbi:hypothetical protein ACP4OV_003530 [Aristida adscensionis]
MAAAACMLFQLLLLLAVAANANRHLPGARTLLDASDDGESR